MSSPHVGPGVTTYGLPERFFEFVGGLPGWWFQHYDADAAREYLIRVEQAGGHRFKATYYQPLQVRGIGAGQGLLPTFETVDGAHRGAVTAIAAHGVNRGAAAVREQAPASLFGGDGKGARPTKTRWL